MRFTFINCCCCWCCCCCCLVCTDSSSVDFSLFDYHFVLFIDVVFVVLLRWWISLILLSNINWFNAQCKHKFYLFFFVFCCEFDCFLIFFYFYARTLNLLFSFLYSLLTKFSVMIFTTPRRWATYTHMHLFSYSNLSTMIQFTIKLNCFCVNIGHNLHSCVW